MKKIYLLLTIYFLATTTQAQWTQKGADIDGEAADDQSGFSVSMSSDGNTLATGARYNDGTSQLAGHVRVYQWSGSAWTQKGADIDGEASGNYSGWSVSMSSDGKTLTIGALTNNGAGLSAGHVRVYEWSGSAWIQKGADIDGEAAQDHSGGSVSMSSDGNTVAIGADQNDGTATNAGHVRIYEWSGSAWTQKGADIDGEAAEDKSGFSVSMSSDGNTVAIGAHKNDGIASDAGHVRIYEWSGSAWTQKGTDIDGEAVQDWSGYSVSMSSDGNAVAIGAYGNDGTTSSWSQGHVRVYEWSGSAWIQKGADIDGEAVQDWSGYSVSMSSDGNTVAIGAPYNDGTDTGAGHVRVYQWSGSAWTQTGADIDGEAADDWSGFSVSMSSDGNTVSIGAVFNDGTGSDAGHVRVYSICSTTSSTDTQTACDSYLWLDGNTYTASNNTATDTLTNAAACDSVVTLDLTITNSTSGTDVQTACDSFLWIDGNTYTASNNTATDTLTNAAACDSVVTLDLTVLNSVTGTDTQTTCDSLVWIDGNTYTTSNSTATHTLANMAGCDSIVTLNLTINTVNSSVTQTGVLLTADEAGANYQWLNCPGMTAITGATNQEYTATANGNYAVIVTNNGCSDTSACYTVSAVGIIENDFGNNLV
ncbi:MAG TPA: hypothetical protein EYN51_09415, partial [Flavobacteriales bacterium]|nr:hypothetical protein [Flavobacteriales bacterium]